MHGKIQRESAIKSLYVSDVSRWDAAKLKADEMGISMSELVMAGIDKFVNDRCLVCERVAEVIATGSMRVKAKAKK
jgi:hypothetical protein